MNCSKVVVLQGYVLGLWEKSAYFGLLRYSNHKHNIANELIGHTNKIKTWFIQNKVCDVAFFLLRWSLQSATVSLPTPLSLHPLKSAGSIGAGVHNYPLVLVKEDLKSCMLTFVYFKVKRSEGDKQKKLVVEEWRQRHWSSNVYMG